MKIGISGQSDFFIAVSLVTTRETWPWSEFILLLWQEMQNRESIKAKTLTFRSHSPHLHPRLQVFYTQDCCWDFSIFIFPVLSISFSLLLISQFPFSCSPSSSTTGRRFFLSLTHTPTPLLPTNLPHLRCHAVGPLLLFQLNNNFRSLFCLVFF